MKKFIFGLLLLILSTINMGIIGAMEVGEKEERRGSTSGTKRKIDARDENSSEEAKEEKQPERKKHRAFFPSESLMIDNLAENITRKCLSQAMRNAKESLSEAALKEEIDRKEEETGGFKNWKNILRMKIMGVLSREAEKHYDAMREKLGACWSAGQCIRKAFIEDKMEDIVSCKDGGMAGEGIPFYISLKGKKIDDISDLGDGIERCIGSINTYNEWTNRFISLCSVDLRDNEIVMLPGAWLLRLFRDSAMLPKKLKLSNNKLRFVNIEEFNELAETLAGASKVDQAEITIDVSNHNLSIDTQQKLAECMKKSKGFLIKER